MAGPVRSCALIFLVVILRTLPTAYSLISLYQDSLSLWYVSQYDKGFRHGWRASRALNILLILGQDETNHNQFQGVCLRIPHGQLHGEERPCISQKMNVHYIDHKSPTLRSPVVGYVKAAHLITSYAVNIRFQQNPQA